MYKYDYTRRPALSSEIWKKGGPDKLETGFTFLEEIDSWSGDGYLYLCRVKRKYFIWKDLLLILKLIAVRYEKDNQAGCTLLMITVIPYLSWYTMPVILSFLKSKRTFDSGPFRNVIIGSSITLPMMVAVISLSRKRDTTASEFFGETDRTNPKLWKQTNHSERSISEGLGMESSSMIAPLPEFSIIMWRIPKMPALLKSLVAWANSFLSVFTYSPLCQNSCTPSLMSGRFGIRFKDKGYPVG